jgi:hypothetical protein
MNEEEKIKKAVKEASASLWIDKLPLDKEYVEAYLEKRLNDLENTEEKGKAKVLKRGAKK